MARSRAENQKKHSGIERLALTIDEFCASGHFSRSYYEAEKRRGRGPKETRFGRAVRITPPNAAAWIADRTTSK
jgi:hypothetical protein